MAREPQSESEWRTTLDYDPGATREVQETDVMEGAVVERLAHGPTYSISNMLEPGAVVAPVVVPDVRKARTSM